MSCGDPILRPNYALNAVRRTEDEARNHYNKMMGTRFTILKSTCAQ